MNGIRATRHILLLALLAVAIAWPVDAFSSMAGPRAGEEFIVVNGHIAFHSNRTTAGNPTGDYEIFTMNANGEHIRQLTQNTGDDRVPVWSPDGAKIAYYSDGAIAVMDADGGNPTPLTNGTFDANPTWSPDGAKIAFTRFENPNTNIFIMNADGTNPTKLDIGGNINSYPDWSPDGARIAFMSNRNGFELAVYTMRTDGSDIQYLGAGTSPSWSPDGEWIAFNRQVEFQNDIFIMNADGSNPRRLTTNSANEFAPDWGPEGGQITFAGAAGGFEQIFTIRVDGSHRRSLSSGSAFDGEPSWRAVTIPAPKPPGIPIDRNPKFTREVIVFSSGRVTAENPEGDEEIFTLTLGRFGSFVTQLTFNASEEDGFPQWSADGRKIAFTRNRDIYTMDADGSNQVQLTNHVKEDLFPAWSPDGARIVFSSNRDSSLQQLFVMNADGSNLTKLTNTSESDQNPDWSPDGSKIVFGRLVRISGDSRFCLFTINPDGTGLTQLTFPDRGNSDSPAWSPDGRSIAFIRNATSVFTMNANGTNQREVVQGPDNTGPLYPNWSPDGNAIVFDAGHEIYTVKANGTSLTNRTNEPADDRSPDWSSSPRQSASVTALTDGGRKGAKGKAKTHKQQDKRDKKDKKDKKNKHGGKAKDRDGSAHRSGANGQRGGERAGGKGGQDRHHGTPGKESKRKG